MAVMNPDTTGYGMYLMYLPKPSKPSPICIIPANKKTPSITGNALAMSPLNVATIPATTTILTAVIGAVGPDI